MARYSIEAEQAESRSRSRLRPMAQSDMDGWREASVLIVEDSLELRSLLTLLVAGAGVRVRAARDGAEGLQLFRQFMPNVVVTDVTMPRLDGLTLCRCIRGEEGGAPTPIILFTGRDRDAGVEAALALGSVIYVRKRDGVNAVIEAVTRLLPRANLAIDAADALSGCTPWTSFTGLAGAARRPP